MKKRICLILALFFTFSHLPAKSNVKVSVQGIPVNYKAEIQSTSAFDEDWQKLLFFVGTSAVIFSCFTVGTIHYFWYIDDRYNRK